MASVRELLQKSAGKQTRKTVVDPTTGQLVEAPEQDIQQLATQAGLPTTPTSPASQALLGATPDQTKMAGTPAQKSSSLRMSTGAQPDLQTTLRQQQVRTQKTASEEAETQKAQQLAGLGDLQGRVQNLIRTSVVPTQQVAGLGTVDASSISGITPENAAATTAALQAYTDSGDINQLAEASRLLGRVVQPEEVAGILQDPSKILGAAVATATPDQLTVQQLRDQGLSYSDRELADLLGMPAQDVAGMSLQQLQDAVQQATTQEFQQVEEVRRQATNPNLGPAERAAARDQLREASGTGMASTEEDVRKLEESVASADQVEFGGQEYSVEELLQDDHISDLISEYLDAPEDSDIRKHFDESEPALAEYIRQNETALSDAARARGDTAGTYKQVVEDNKKLTTTPSGVTLSDSVLEKLVPGYDKFSADKFDPASNPYLEIMQSGTPEGEQLAQEMNRLATTNPAILDEISGLTSEEIKQLGIATGSQTWQDYVQYQDALSRIEATMQSDPTQAYAAATGGVAGDPAQLQSYLDEQRFYSNLTGEDTTGNYSALDANRDGILDPPQSVLQTLQADHHSIRDILAGSPKPSLPNMGAVAPTNPVVASIMNKFKGQLGSAGKISPSLVASTELSGEEMRYLLEPSRGTSLAPDARTRLLGKYGKLVADNTAKLTTDLGNIQDPVIRLQELDKIVAGGLVDLDPGKLAKLRKLYQSQVAARQIYSSGAAVPTSGTANLAGAPGTTKPVTYQIKQ